jgi:hypothetical protein
MPRREQDPSGPPPGRCCREAGEEAAGPGCGSTAEEEDGGAAVEGGAEPASCVGKELPWRREEDEAAAAAARHGRLSSYLQRHRHSETTKKKPLLEQDFQRWEKARTRWTKLEHVGTGKKHLQRHRAILQTTTKKPSPRAGFPAFEKKTRTRLKKSSTFEQGGKKHLQRHRAILLQTTTKKPSPRAGFPTFVKTRTRWDKTRARLNGEKTSSAPSRHFADDDEEAFPSRRIFPTFVKTRTRSSTFEQGEKRHRPIFFAVGEEEASPRARFQTLDQTRTRLQKTNTFEQGKKSACPLLLHSN